MIHLTRFPKYNITLLCSVHDEVLHCYTIECLFLDQGKTHSHVKEEDFVVDDWVENLSVWASFCIGNFSRWSSSFVVWIRRNQKLIADTPERNRSWSHHNSIIHQSRLDNNEEWKGGGVESVSLRNNKRSSIKTSDINYFFMYLHALLILWFICSHVVRMKCMLHRLASDYTLKQK